VLPPTFAAAAAAAAAAASTTTLIIASASLLEDRPKEARTHRISDEQNEPTSRPQRLGRPERRARIILLLLH